VKIALVQQHAAVDRADNLKRGVAAFREAAGAGAGMIVYPELSFLRFLPERPATPEALEQAETIPGPTTDIFSTLAREFGVVTIINLLERDGRRTYDSSPVIDADGDILGTVRMTHIMEGPGFHESGFYAPGGDTELVFPTAHGRVGVAVCYDRHFPEYMRALALQEAELVVVPQAGAVGEWAPGIFEAELQVAAFQNGYFAALANRVGKEDVNEFAGESFVVDPDGRVIARAGAGKDAILYAECDLSQTARSFARRHFLKDRRPEFYSHLKLTK
jgi:predicted amidohydrolase